jgi:cytochrome P450
MSAPADCVRVVDGAARASFVPTDVAFCQDPYPAYEAMRAVAPAVFWEELGLWCLTGYDAVNAILRDRRFGREVLHVATREEADLPEPAEHVKPFYAVDDLSMLAREPPVHTRLRTLVNRAFVSRRIESLRPRIAWLSNDLIDGFAGEGRVELISRFATLLPVTIIAELLGVPTSTTGSLLDWSHRMVAMYTPRRDREVEDSAVAATQEFVAFLRDYVRERRRNPREDLISHMIAAEAAGDRLSEDELIAGVIQLLNAGHEATVHSIGNAVKAILESGLPPGALFADEAVTSATIEESLRFDPPLHFFDRYALEPLEIFGLRLRKGEKIGLLLAAANRDPARWERPQRFDPARPLQSHVAFGGGIHFCIGAPLARLELQVALPVLFRRLRELKLEKPLRYQNTWHFRGLERMDVCW